ncbi:uncharacterized protein Z518_01097 [Rhinocladiella mackenziei CBS 650.93]|uniref:DUF6594 domain-containing protein n=1 Tax=Rhinocladiella mackenziei CBS 650.93 TaxID=1442369 RepID=A0A0D2J307_9EURO|nr:uncharacterized protein Z518_01097 [Rhinocladiella mackenziei CBS 650.93]KIX10016.1 hypothetical protein Z518_01097 [Rhinocladiella mackenziei CBS 650.93]
MATVIAPVELPTSRRSYFNTDPTPDIHDPNWIPVLDSAAFKSSSPSIEKEASPFGHASFSLFPATSSNSPKPRPGFSHNYSKSSLAPESIASSDSRSQSPQDGVDPSSSLGGPVQPAQNEPRGQHRRQTSTGDASSEEKISVGTEAAGEGPSAPSTDGTASVAEERTSSRQEPRQDQHEDSLANVNGRSSMTSTRRTTVLPPTSKYNRKQVAPMATSMARPSLIPSLPQTPQDSPRLGPSVPVGVTSIPVVQALPSPKLPPTDPPQPPESTPRLGPAKSSASERRQRALHSHPSNISMRSQRNSLSEDIDIIPKPPSVRHKPRKSADSRATTPRSTIYDSQVPTPAPTTPLPQLPPQARRPSTRENGSQRPAQTPGDDPVPSTISNIRALEHARMAAFMAEKNVIVFRRFDDVHVRLLLCLQDEISLLEQELLKLENSTSAGSPSEKMVQKTRVLRELRKLVAEYDHLFTTWSKMQASKASETTTNELKNWRVTPGTSAEAGLGIDIQQDLPWWENSQDLSSLAFREKQKSPEPKPENNKGGGGFPALFGCGGKRK